MTTTSELLTGLGRVPPVVRLLIWGLQGKAPLCLGGDITGMRFWSRAVETREASSKEHIGSFSACGALGMERHFVTWLLFITLTGGEIERNHSPKCLRIRNVP